MTDGWLDWRYPAGGGSGDSGGGNKKRLEAGMTVTLKSSGKRGRIKKVGEILIRVVLEDGEDIWVAEGEIEV